MSRALHFLHFFRDSGLDEMAGVEDVRSIVHEFLQKFFHADNLPEPVLKIRDNIAAGWLGRCSFKRGESNTTIEVQKSILHDDETLRRVLAHELCHHWQFLRDNHTDKGDLARRAGIKFDGHGEGFLKKAGEINKVLGHDYVTPKSDASYSVERTKEFYVIIQPRYQPGEPEILKGEFGWTTAVKPSAAQKQEIRDRVATKGAKVFKTANYDLFGAASIKKFGGYSFTRKPETNDLLKKMYDTEKEVSL